MLVELTIENVALIERARLEFDRGLTALTGETGSGKSILLDALGLALGARAGSELIRHGAQRARVEAVFHIAPDHPHLGDWVASGQIDPDDPVVILHREFDKNGRSSARCNGRAVPVAVLRDWAEKLIDVHGQHEHQSLLDESQHIQWLDQWIGEQARDLRGRTARSWRDWRNTRQEWEKLKADARERSREIEMISFQVDEINTAALQPGEDEDLTRERDRHAHAERLTSASDTAHRLLENAVATLGKAVTELQRVQMVDPAIEILLASANEAFFSAEDGARSCRQYRDGIEFNSQRLSEIEDRLEIIRGLKRKYGETIHDILEFRDQAQRRLDVLGNAEESLETLEKRANEFHAHLLQACSELSNVRRSLASELSGRIRQELADLAMGAALFDVHFDSMEPGPDGADRVAFRMSTNPGVPPRPLAKIASGGEVSRVMLALKSVFLESLGFGTLVFDEIDSGIGGRTGVAIAEKLHHLARNTQVFCVTHLPQVAAAAQNQYRIEKSISGEQTILTIDFLDPERRIDEISRMLGDTDSHAAREHATELLNRSRSHLPAQ